MDEDQWYYAIGQQHQGPVTWAQLQQMARLGQLRPNQLIWRDGMDQWTAAGTMSGLFDSFPVASVAASITYAPRADLNERSILRAEKWACLTMFVWAVAVLSALLIPSPPRAGPPSPGWSMIGGCFVTLSAPVGALFAAIYLPVRWHYFVQLPMWYRVVGLLGAVGLIGVTVLMGGAVAFVI